jgi:hypothetical protein
MRQIDSTTINKAAYDIEIMLLIAAVILFVIWGGGLALRAGEFIHIFAVVAVILIGMHILGGLAPDVV